MKKKIFVIYILLLATGDASAQINDNIVIENDNLRYEISPSGRNIHFINKENNIDYLFKDSASYCSNIVKNGARYHASAVRMIDKKKLQVDYSDGYSTVEIAFKNNRKYFVFEIVKSPGTIDEINFINIPLILKGAIDEPLGACALALNDFTHVRQLPALQSHIWANSYRKFRLEGAKVALLTAPVSEILPLIKTVMQKSADIPYSKAGGAWALENKEGYGSYIMNFGGLTRSTVDDWIRMCKDLGFNQIDNHGGGFFNFGELKIDSSSFPGGWKDFREINRKLKAAGISSIFHTYAYFIDKNSKYISPRMHPDLGAFRSFTLAKSLSATDTVITVNESTAEVSTIIGFFVRNSVSLRIGDELIEFSGVTSNPPYQFTGCKRGAYKTNISAHAANEKAYHLKEVYGRFIADPGTALFKEMAKKTADIVNEAEFTGIYLDAVDGGDVLGGADYFWYYPSQFVFEIVKNLKRPVGMEMASMTHYWWHYRSRWQAWDSPQRGFKRFIDLHLAAIKSPNLFLMPKIKSNDFEHGVWPGDTALINRYAGLENGALMLPLNLGWWSNMIGQAPQTETTFEDDVEYLAGKLLGNNAGTAILGGFDKDTKQRVPLIGRVDSILQQYEVLRQQKYFDDSVRAILRQPGKEFQLFKQAGGRWNFKPTVYHSHKISGGKEQFSWRVNNSYEQQPLRIRIEALMSVKGYNDPSAEIIADFSKTSDYNLKDVAPGVSGNLSVVEEGIPVGTRSGKLSAGNIGQTVPRGAWLNMEHEYPSALDIENKQGLGVWIKGDGKGELLNFRLESPKHISHGARGDHFVKINFTGWRYFELVELESSEFTNYLWPRSDLHVYDSYRHNISFKEINKFQLWANNLPANSNVNCVIGQVKAIPLVKTNIVNPSLTVNGEKIIFPVTMESEMYLEMETNGKYILYAKDGKPLSSGQLAIKAPLLKNATNDIQFGCESSGGVNPRVKVAVVAQGAPLINY